MEPNFGITLLTLLDPDSKPNGYIELCRSFHTAQSQIQILIQLPNTGMGSESESVPESVSCNVNEPFGRMKRGSNLITMETSVCMWWFLFFSHGILRNNPNMSLCGAGADELLPEDEIALKEMLWVLMVYIFPSRLEIIMPLHKKILFLNVHKNGKQYLLCLMTVNVRLHVPWTSPFLRAAP